MMNIVNNGKGYSKPHDYFLELCAISLSNRLSKSEQEDLRAHLRTCSSCREARLQFEAILDQMIPAVAPEYLPEDSMAEDHEWSQDQAEAKLLTRLTGEEQGDQHQDPEFPRSPGNTLGFLGFPASATWKHVCILFAAGILLTAALALSAYHVGVSRGSSIAKSTQELDGANRSLEQRLSSTKSEYEAVRTQIAGRDSLVADLRHSLQIKQTELNSLKSTGDRFASDLDSLESGKQDLMKERNEFASRLESAQMQVQALQARLDSAEQQASEATRRETTLLAKVKDMTDLLRERDKAVQEQEELLAHDRDIRELMGARELYIAEVFDVARTGQTERPFGRVFYTKGKSLIFYAYDLDKQTLAKNANTFQAWGRRGSDGQHALNLGVFYEDNTSKKRWILKLDDPKTLAQIDAVFVTVEPKGESQLPSGKTLLFTYLRVDPNHP